MRTNLIFWDIETSPAANAADMLGEITAPATYKDPAKIAAYIAEAKAKALERAALSPFTAQILAIGLLKPNHAHPLILHGTDEAVVLEYFWKEYEASRTPGQPHEWVGWNSNEFDLPMVIRRSWANGITVPPVLTERGYPCPWFIDLRTTWGIGDKRAEGTLGAVCKLLGIGEKHGDGADFAKLYAADVEKALEYLRFDLRLTAKLAERLMGL